MVVTIALPVLIPCWAVRSLRILHVPGGRTSEVVFVDTRLCHSHGGDGSREDLGGWVSGTEFSTLSVSRDVSGHPFYRDGGGTPNRPPRSFVSEWLCCHFRHNCYGLGYHRMCPTTWGRKSFYEHLIIFWTVCSL